MNRKTLVVGILAVAALALAAVLVHRSRAARLARENLVLYGNVDLRQVDLAFNASERIAEVLVQEGDRVRRGQVLARVDTSRLRPELAEAEGNAAAAQAVVDRLHHGSRPEEIAQAAANVELARADLVDAQRQWDRAMALSRRTTGLAISRQQIDDAQAARDAARARLAVAEKARDLAVLGPRAEDVAQGEAQLQSAEAHLALVRRELADAELTAPSDAVVRSRLLEPGEMASPQRPVLELALTEPKWVRAYVSEPDLGRVHPGASASVEADGFSGKAFAGWVGYISSVAEFTPKTVQTEDLRSNLVFEVRVFVRDPDDQLRLGLPTTVRIRDETASR